MDYMHCSTRTRPLLEGLAALSPRTLATVHGSAFNGDAPGALIDLDAVMKETLA